MWREVDGLIPWIFRNEYWQDLMCWLWQVRGGSCKDGLLDSGLRILVEALSHSLREHWKRICVAEEGDYESMKDLLNPGGGRKAIGCGTPRGLG